MMTYFDITRSTWNTMLDMTLYLLPTKYCNCLSELITKCTFGWHGPKMQSAHWMIIFVILAVKEKTKNEFVQDRHGIVGKGACNK